VCICKLEWSTIHLWGSWFKRSNFQTKRPLLLASTHCHVLASLAWDPKSRWCRPSDLRDRSNAIVGAVAQVAGPGSWKRAPPGCSRDQHSHTNCHSHCVGVPDHEDPRDQALPLSWWVLCVHDGQSHTHEQCALHVFQIFEQPGSRPCHGEPAWQAGSRQLWRNQVSEGITWHVVSTRWCLAGLRPPVALKGVWAGADCFSGLELALAHWRNLKMPRWGQWGVLWSSTALSNHLMRGTDLVPVCLFSCFWQFCLIATHTYAIPDE